MTSESELQGRTVECAQLARLLASARAGASGALVVRGEAGVGKSALLEYLSSRASGCAIARAAGVESEMELAFAGLHQVCAPFLDRLDRLPSPQADALRTAFGLHAGPPPDPFLVGLATLSLLSDVAETRPLVCLIDDMQWLDRASAQVLGFLARRLADESVLVVFAVREPGEDPNLAGLRKPGPRSASRSPTPEPSWPRPSPADSINRCGIGSWPSLGATHWPCSRCRAPGRRRPSPEASACPTRCRFPVGSKRASGVG